jgi:predicted TIM-barrel fold metal-dependent hydrolase
MIIDGHTHAFEAEDLKVNIERMALLDAHLSDDDPDKWWVRGVGDLDGLVSGQAEAGVDRMVLLPVSGKKDRCADLIRWSAAAAVKHPQIIPFGLLHPRGNVRDDLDLALELGMRGIKLHPFVQRFSLDDELTYAMLGMIEESGLPVLLDTLHAEGLIKAKPHLEWIMQSFGFMGCEPEQIARAAKAFPRLRIIAAHGGSLYGWEHLGPLYDLDNVYFDISYLKGLLAPEKVVELIRRKKPERVIYGSDCPYRHPARYRAWFEELSLSKEERDQVASATLLKLLGE